MFNKQTLKKNDKFATYQFVCSEKFVPNHKSFNHFTNYLGELKRLIDTNN